MLNSLFVTVTLLSVFLAASTGRMEALTAGIVESAKDSVQLALGLVGTMTLFLGLMKVAEDGGLMRTIARVVSPFLRILFPNVPSDSPAMGAIVMNISANMLGLANAATPFGIRAMEELDKLNTRQGTATNAMAMFLALNTSAVALLPSGMIALRVSLGSNDPASIFVTTWFASGIATIAGVSAAWLFSQLPYYRTTEPALPLTNGTNQPPLTTATLEMPRKPLRNRLWFGWAFLLALLILAIRQIAIVSDDDSLIDSVRSLMSFWSIPFIVSAFVLYGWVKGVSVYDSLVEGGKQGFQVALRIIPFLVAILVMVEMFRASGALEMVIIFVEPLTSLIGMPPEALPMAMLRPLTGSGAFGVAADAMSTHGPDSLIGYMVSTYAGSTETTFYTLAVYFGAVGIRKSRHTLPACLLADVSGILAATFIVNLLLG